MSEFKVGDRVTPTIACRYGQIGTIRSKSIYHATVSWPDGADVLFELCNLRHANADYELWRLSQAVTGWHLNAVIRQNEELGEKCKQLRAAYSSCKERLGETQKRLHDLTAERDNLRMSLDEATKYRWIDIIEEPKVGLTRRFAVRNRRSGVLLGWIRWYGVFRGYAFLPCEGTAYEEDCLRDLAECLEGLTAEHKATRKQGE